MKRETYKRRFVVVAQSSELKDRSGWNVEGYIEEHDGAGVNFLKEINSAEVLTTEEEALEFALALGRRIVDDEYSR